MKNRSRILEAAEELFSSRNPAEVSIREIAGKSGIGTGTLYRNFRNRSELCLALVYRNLDRTIDEMAEESEICADPGERLRIMLKCYMRFRDENRNLLAQVEGEIGLQFYQGSRFRRLCETFSNALGPYFEDEAELSFRAEMLIAMLKSDIYVYERHVRGRSIDELIERLISMIRS